ncbi:nuclear transport factor 2 family protein [Geodermatophilus sp. SYSU D00691]
MTTAPDDVAARLDRLESLAALTRLAHDYCQAFDERLLDRFLELWHDDATWEMLPGTVLEGHEGIRSATEGAWASLPATRHLTSNHVVDLDGDSATGSAQVVAFVQSPDGAWAEMVFTYTDTYERRAGRWAFTRRGAAPHLQTTLAGG